LDAAQLQLNAMLPLVVSELLNSQEDLYCAMDALRVRCISGIVVNRQRHAELVQHNLGELTSIAASGGYALATRAAQLSDGAQKVAVSHAGREVNRTGGHLDPDQAH
jgi:aspartate ammonia-lyase